MKRLAYVLLLILGLLVVLRFIAVPLARQRQDRRLQAPTLLARLPADPQRWILRRHFTRPFPEALWPGSADRFETILADWELPLASLRGELDLNRLWGGEWLGALFEGGDWFLGGPRNRLGKGAAGGAMKAWPADTLLVLEVGWLRLTPARFLCASRQELLEGESWLAALPEWSELNDLLLAGDWLEYERCGSGGALLTAKRLEEALLFEGLAWACPDGEQRLLAMAPTLRAALPAAAAALDSLPYLRRGGPFDPGGRTLPPLPGGARLARNEASISGERLWGRDATRALSRVSVLPATPRNPWGKDH